MTAIQHVTHILSTIWSNSRKVVLGILNPSSLRPNLSYYRQYNIKPYFKLKMNDVIKTHFNLTQTKPSTIDILL